MPCPHTTRTSAICATCGTAFHPWKRRQKFCSTGCSGRSREKNPPHTGQLFGRLTVIDPHVSQRSARGRIRWMVLVCCSCDPSRCFHVSKDALVEVRTRSCGCLLQEARRSNTRTHGESKTRLYRVWASMRNRCHRPGVRSYAAYGGRGITVCQEWRDSFAAFRSWAEQGGYQEGLSIERIDVNGNYEPENCCFIPISKQSSNIRRNVWITAFGETKILKDWSEDPRCVVSYGALSERIRVGRDPEEALTRPARPRLP